MLYCCITVLLCYCVTVLLHYMYYVLLLHNNIACGMSLYNVLSTYYVNVLYCCIIVYTMYSCSCTCTQHLLDYCYCILVFLYSCILVLACRPSVLLVWQI